MTPEIMIIVSGEGLDEEKAQSALARIPGLTVEKVGQGRGLAQGALKVAKWVGKLAGDTSKIADAFIGEAAKGFAGASIEIQAGTTVIKINNANRDQLNELLDKAAAAAGLNSVK